MSDYQTIKELVIEASMEEGSFPSYEKLTSLVLKHFPTSKWQKTHYAWYKSKIKRGEIEVPGFESPTHEETIVEVNEDEIQETIDASISLERDLHTYLASRTEIIETGLSLAEDGIEHLTETGRIDILAIDSQNNYVVIELKAGKAKDAALGQLLGYMGFIASSPKYQNNVRGILVASEFDKRVVYAAKAISNVKLLKYRVEFELNEVT